MIGPAVSVALAVKDGARHLPQALDTLLAQSFEDFELIAVDDGSADATWEIIQGYAARDARVLPIRNEVNLGLAASLNRIIAMARAPLIARADADDVYHPERLARQVAFMADNPTVGVLSCGFRRIDETGQVLGVELAHEGTDRLRFHMMFVNSFLHPGVMMRTDVVRRFGGYNTSFRIAQDTELWLRLSGETVFDNIRDPLVDYRCHMGQVTAGGEAKRSMSAELHRAALSRYLGRELAAEEAGDARAVFFMPNPIPAAAALSGERVLREIRTAMVDREPLRLRRDFRRRIANALRRVAWTAQGADRRELLLASLDWAPSWRAARGLAGGVLRAAAARVAQ